MEELKELERKQRNVGRSYESLTSQASAVLNFTLEWKDLDRHYASTRDKLRVQFEELERREEEMERFKAEMESRAEELRKIEAAIEEKKKEFEQGEFRLLSVESLIDEFNQEIKVKEGLRSDVEKLIRDKKRVLSEIETRSVNLNLGFEKKEKKLERFEEVFRECSRNVEVQERRLSEVKALVEEKTRELDLKEDEILAAKKYIGDCDQQLRSKEERLGLVEESIAKSDEMLEMKEKLIGVLDLKARDFSEVNTRMEEWSCKLEAKEKEIEGWVGKLESKEKQLESRAEELTVIETGVKGCLSEVEMKGIELDSLERSLIERDKELELLKKAVLHRSRGSEDNRDGRGLQEFMNEHLKRIDAVGTGLSALLKESSDPGKLVLDAMQGFYPENRELDFELRVRRRSCILLLEELGRMSAEIVPQVREEAIKLAADWKDKMTVPSENELEVLGFLRLVAAYNLASTYDTEELRRLLSSISYRQQAAQLHQALGIADKAPESSFICSPASIEKRVNIEEPANNEEPETSLANNAVTISSPNCQSNSTAYESGSLGFSDKLLSWISNSIQNEILASVRTATHPEKLVLNIIQNSFVKYWTNEDANMRKRVMLTNIAVLVALLELSPKFGPQVKEDAIKIAVQWKGKIRASSESFPGILGFMLFIITYGLLSTLNGEEIVQLLEILSQHKEAVESCQAYGLPSKTVAVYIRTLVERKQLFGALRYIFVFKLHNKFPPVPILNEYLEDVKQCRREAWKTKISIDEKMEFVDSQILGLRAMIECFRDYKVESVCPFNGIELQIIELEKLKEFWRDPQQEPSQGKKRSSNTSSPTFQTGQQNISKFPRTAEANSRASTLPAYNPAHLYAPMPSSMAYGNHGQYRQSGNMAANSNPNFGAIENAGGHNLPLSYPLWPDRGRYGPFGFF